MRLVTSKKRETTQKDARKPEHGRVTWQDSNVHKFICFQRRNTSRMPTKVNLLIRRHMNLTFLHCQIYGNPHTTEVDKFENEYHAVVFVDFIDQLHVDTMMLIHIYPKDAYFT